MKKLRSVVAVAVCATSVFTMGGCLKYTDNILEITKAPMSDESSSYAPDYPYYSEVNTSADITQPGEVTTALQPVTDARQESPVTQPTVTQPAPVTPSEPQTSVAEKDPSQWSKAEILSFVTAAVNKSKAYNGKLSVGHKESFDANIDSISVGGSTIQKLANSIITSVTKPTDETLNFVNGKTTTSEGETVPILLPKRQNFALTIDGLASASASKSGKNTVVNLKLVSESTTLANPVPKHNAAACGYMSLSDVDLPSVVTVNKLDFKYTGSTMQLTVNENGYVASCTYTIPVVINGNGDVKITSADFQVTAKIVEVWTLNW